MSGEQDSDQLVTLGLDNELFAVPVGLVREILDMRQPFHIPEAPPHLAGLIDVRGQAVPVIDLRLKLGLAPSPATADTRILVLDVPIGSRCLSLGLIADRVIEVAPLDPGTSGPPPEIGTRWRCEYIQGIGRRGDSFVVVFDIPRLLSGEASALIASATVPASVTPLKEEQPCA